MRSTSSTGLPSEAERRYRIFSSISFKSAFILALLMISWLLASSRSGRSSATTMPMSWSCRPLDRDKQRGYMYQPGTKTSYSNLTDKHFFLCKHDLRLALQFENLKLLTFILFRFLSFLPLRILIFFTYSSSLSIGINALPILDHLGDKVKLTRVTLVEISGV